MDILRELGEISAAKYGLGLKDPIFSAFDKLGQEDKFEFIKNIIEDDYAEYDGIMNEYYNTNKTCKTIRNIFDLLTVLNGRKGYFAKHQDSHSMHYDESNVGKWVNMLANELKNSGTGNPSDGIYDRGSGVVNGIKMRAAIYHLLDILQYSGSVTYPMPIVSGKSPLCILGRDIINVAVHGTEEGFGVRIDPNLDYYGAFIFVKNLYTGEEQRFGFYWEDGPLTEGRTAYCDIPEGTVMPYALYEVNVGIDFELTPETTIYTDIDVHYHAIREHYIPDISEYIYELFGPQNLKAKTIFYKGDSSRVIVPDTFETGSLDIVGINTFAESSVEKVYIPDGVTSIE